MKGLPRERQLIVFVHMVIIVTMALILILSVSPENPEWWVLAVLFVPPVLAISFAISKESRPLRFIAYLVVAVLMIPAAGLGIFGGWGILYLIGIIFLLAAAWQENEGRGNS